MLSFEKFLLLCKNSPEVNQREKFRLFKSLRKFVLFKFMPEKKFEKAREKELGLQKKSLERLEVSAIGNLKKLILFIMLDEIDVYADILGKKISSSEKYRVLFGKRIEHCEKFLELSSGDDLTLEETAHRYKTYCELVISKETRNRIGSGLKTAALVIGAGTTAFLTLKSVMGKVREKKKEHK